MVGGVSKLKSVLGFEVFGSVEQLVIETLVVKSSLPSSL